MPSNKEILVQERMHAFLEKKYSNEVLSNDDFNNSISAIQAE
jgi:hypothetical protein